MEKAEKANAPLDPELVKEGRQQIGEFIESVRSAQGQPSKAERNNIFEESNSRPDNSGAMDAQRKRAIAEKEKNKGNEAMKAKEWDEAVTCYQKAVALDPNNHLIYGNMAQSYLSMKSSRSQ